MALHRDLRDFHLEAEFSIGKGETFVLIGENGSGKSSLLYLLSGLLSPESGFISLDNRVLYDGCKGIHIPAEERDIGFVFQNYAIFPHLTVFENVAFGLRRRKVPESELRSRVAENLALLSLEHLSDVRADQLSGGECQRAALARALVIEPSLLLLDEPVSALDAIAQERMRSQICAYVRKSGIPCITVTHSFRDAVSLGDRLGVMERGRIIQDGDLEEVMGSGNTFLHHFFCGCKKDSHRL
ncbi:MAG: ATP-binding cassette domain-containing protein [Methanoregulaceae archaeon]|nr:ATP-binding cassette domain-containing protein [Methanoregulaceae archaeon]